MSIPEKSAGLQLPHLQPASFVHGLMKATLAAAESRQAAQEAVTRPSQLLGNEVSIGTVFMNAFEHEILLSIKIL